MVVFDLEGFSYVGNLTSQMVYFLSHCMTGHWWEWTNNFINFVVRFILLDVRTKQTSMFYKNNAFIEFFHLCFSKD